ncbi:proline dehydrogenase family protein [Kibdelosporangium philippinense]|uniref:proline dehydrogenase n=1 Tax=Kibdelosporangium philippinense TaxID=211113 RepID=A0ABS8ZF87_9PSEU|nr:proline dehydrogenase family protein [Kibdelosporangium philippinense]MCE7005575.1 proline dehydrogenase family protein [Kibdelosporangium philippinense]
MHPLRSLILAAAGNDAIRRLVATAPVSRDVVRRFVAGEQTSDAIDVTRELVASGRSVTLDHLGEDVADAEHADQNVRAYLELLDALHAEGLAPKAEVSVKLSALGQKLGERLALANASRVCAAAEQCGTTVTLDMEDHTTTDSTLRVLAELRRSWPSTGAVLQSYLRRTFDDCKSLAGSRVRLVKGAYAEPDSVAFDGHEVDLSYVRCVNALLTGDGYPMFATHDPRLVRIVAERARWYDRKPGTYEYQMLFGVRQEEQRRLAREGETVRVYVPYGSQWYGYLMRRLAERPANTTFFARALVSHS